MQTLEQLSAAFTRLEAESDALLIALHDAIRRPMGVVPASADPFYSPAMADQAEAIRALKSRSHTLSDLIASTADEYMSPKPPIL